MLAHHYAALFGLLLISGFIYSFSVEAQTTESITYHPTSCKLTSGGHEYAGPVSITITNRTCQAWNVSEPHHNYYTDDTDTFPEGSATGAGNQCRNPTPDYHDGVWCYTTDPEKRWELCNVKFCDCKLSTDRQGLRYQGKTSRTISGRTCQAWYDNYPHRHPYTRAAYFADKTIFDAANNCRNPNASRPDGPWCYTMGTEVVWEYCHIPTCYFSIEITSSEGSTTTTTPSSTISPSPSTPTSPFHWPEPAVTQSQIPPLVWNSDLPKIELDTDYRSNLAPILGGVAGTCLLALLVIALIILCRRRPDLLTHITSKLNPLAPNPSNKGVTRMPPSPESDPNGAISEQGITASPTTPVLATPGLTSRPNILPSFDNPIYDQPRVTSPGVSSPSVGKGGTENKKEGDGLDRITIAGDSAVSYQSLGSVDFA